MKNILFSVSLCFISSAIFAQKLSQESLPASVSTAFKAKFSQAEKANWELDYEIYLASFNMNKIQMEASFDKDGKWLKTETYIKSNELPKAVKDSISKQFAEKLSSYNIEEAKKVESSDKLVYEVEIEKGETSYLITMSEKGSTLKKEIENEETKKNKKAKESK